jgi:nucleoside-diphosphate-sugar epimerase
VTTFSGSTSVEPSAIGSFEPVLVTGAAGFLGSRVVASLLDHGIGSVRCLVRPTTDVACLGAMASGYRSGRVELLRGNLLSGEDCMKAVRDISVVYHLAAGTGQKSFADAFVNSVVATRNLLDAIIQHGAVKRFVNISSFAVYTNGDKPRRATLDEASPVDEHPEKRGEAYCFAKVRQDQLVIQYGRKHGIPYVIVRPGAVYGPGGNGITGRVGSGALGVFLHLGGSNVVPFTYVDNCADAVVLAGLRPGVDGEVFNIVDDDLPTSREFLRLYKRHVRSFRSLSVPRAASYMLCWLWEKYSDWSEGQLPPAFNRRAWHAYWKGSLYTNAKAKRLLGWTPRVTTTEGLRRYFESCAAQGRDVA